MKQSKVCGTCNKHEKGHSTQVVEVQLAIADSLYGPCDENKKELLFEMSFSTAGVACCAALRGENDAALAHLRLALEAGFDDMAFVQVMPFVALN